jgi:hypothetical protein
MSSVIAKLSQELSNTMTLKDIKDEIEIFRNHGPACAESIQLRGMWMLYQILEEKYGGD